MTFRDNRANIHYDKTVILYHFPGNAWTTRCFFGWFLSVFLLIHGQNVENEAFCVKWGPNEDHFSNLVLMRTKSSIEDFYGSAVYLFGTRAFEFFTKLGVPFYCFHDLDIAPQGLTISETRRNLEKLIKLAKKKLGDVRM